MSDHVSRADVTSRARAADSWDAGLHAESAVGPIDLGLSVEPAGLGLILDAPHVGQIRLALDVDEDGQTRLTSISRRMEDGREASMLAADAAITRELTALRAQQQELQERTAQLETERDEARARAGLVMEERRTLEEQVSELKATLGSRHDGLQATTAELELARAAHLDALTEKEALKAANESLHTKMAHAEKDAEELVRTRMELAQATVQLEDVRTARSALEEQLLTSHGETEQASDQAEAHALKVSALEASLAASEERADALSRQAADGTLHQVQLEKAQARLAELESALAAAQSDAAKVPELESALALAQSDAAKIPELESSLSLAQSATAKIPKLEAAVAAGKAQSERVTELEQALAEAQLAAGAREAELERELLEARAAASSTSETDRLQAELDGANAQLTESLTVIKEWEASLNIEQAATFEAREIARQLKEQVDQITKERDEARTIARQLHQKMGAGKTAPTQVDRPRIAADATETDRPAIGGPGDSPTEPHKAVTAGKTKK